jgi:putative phosphoesterase
MEAIAPTTAVLGNTDGDMPINESAVTTLGDKKFFVQHIVEPNRLEAPLRERLKRIEPDVVVFGHTHEPYCETIGGILFLNPGSVTRPRGGSQPGMVRLTIDNGKITPEFIKL